jgi:hypothetical protein
MSQEAKEQEAKTLTRLARELSDSGGPLLNDTIDANHLQRETTSLRTCTAVIANSLSGRFGSSVSS